MRIIPLARKMRVVTRHAGAPARTDRRPLRWVTLGIVFALTVLTTSPSLWTGGLPSTAGEEIEEPIGAEASFSYFPRDSRQRWEELRNRQYTRVFAYDPEVRSRHIGRIERILTAAGEVRAVQDFRPALSATDEQLDQWSDTELATLVRLADDERFRSGAVLVLEELYNSAMIAIITDAARYRENPGNRRVVQSGSGETVGEDLRIAVWKDDTDIDLSNLVRRRLASVIAEADGSAPKSVVDSPAGEVAMRLLKLGVAPNLALDEEASAREKAAFPPAQPVRIAKGTVLAPASAAKNGQAAGTVWPHALTENEAHVLAAYAQTLTRVKASKFAAQVFFVLIAFLIISFFVMKFSRELGFNSNTVLMLALPVLLALMLGRLFLVLGGEGTQYAGYAFPAGVIGILGVLLLDVRLAILLVTWGCLLFGLEASLEYEFVIVGLFGGYAAVAALYNFRERREVLYAGLLIGLTNAATISILQFIGDSELDLLTAATIGALSGIMCSLISFAVLPVFEVAFRITTDMRLLELCGLQHPLLKRMEEVAPGTLQHTLNVAKLAESAASAIGVSYLLVRAGCYFHDIGKMAKPEYFTENQLTADDKKRHNDLKPQMSTLIIKNHVKEGLELARQHNLPPVVTAFIAEHHGTTIIEYFFRKAKAQLEDGTLKEPVREEDYRYPGPKPQSIETAVVMLADTVEATATAKLSGRTVREDDIQQIVRNAVTHKFNDGQFDDCNLTLRDLNLIRESFIKTLRSRFHSRIDYPGAKRDEGRPEKTPKRPKTQTDETQVTQTEGDDDTQKLRQIATTG